MRRKIIAIVGDAKIEENGLKEKMAFEMGKALVDNGFRVQSGGLRGVMEAGFRGAHASEKYADGDTVAIVPSFDNSDANEFADIAIATGLDVFRNVIVANADAVIAIGGGAGTLTEVCNAWALKRLIISFDNVEGTSKNIANKRLDTRVRYENVPEDKIFGVSSAEQAIELLKKYLPKYNKAHEAIPTNL